MADQPEKLKLGKGASFFVKTQGLYLTGAAFQRCNVCGSQWPRQVNFNVRCAQRSR